jgi:hypothetical protein
MVDGLLLRGALALRMWAAGGGEEENQIGRRNLGAATTEPANGDAPCAWPPFLDNTRPITLALFTLG